MAAADPTVYVDGNTRADSQSEGSCGSADASVDGAPWSVSISSEPLNIASEFDSLPRSPESTGALASFTGYVRGEGISAMSLEHYPGMTEASILETIAKAAQRWPIERARVIHRVGELKPGDPIVWVATISSHRAAAFSACEYIMDYLKVSAPLWKRERNMNGDWHWVDAKASDDARVMRWNTPPMEVSQ